ncbi:helix-turn-helix domain-containing protein [Alteromonas sp. ASW11-130]|uniref:helix-turn-helix domain-containing protein n=1 Tax=Alteromonas sp. ASW11-130 TaxID=3015775 RepID=UPI002241EE35|nr:helix-turn-helix domain-containing protein [Alteromonas sp. ASW11-130]MCW8093340.1 helix-turn-helix domain-containing protein [Alteromonas sp. ASW11-130]
MESLSFVNLIHASSFSVCILGGMLLWRVHNCRGIALLLYLVAFASFVNIAEETGITRDIYLISPIFIMLFGPAFYLAVKKLTGEPLDKKYMLHFLPVVPVIFMTENVQLVIAIGTIWRLCYAYLTVVCLLSYKKLLDQERSDADDFSFRWLIGLVIATAFFNFIDLIRLNSQHLISYEVNVFGQGVNNVIWFVAVLIIIVKALEQTTYPVFAKNGFQPKINDVANTDTSEEYQSTFSELDRLIISNQWFLTPKLTLNELGQLTGLQVREISRAVNLVAGKSFNEYINCYRVNYVCEKIKQGNSHSLTQLFHDAGFSSKASFNKSFKQVVGVTPSEYRASTLSS